MHFSDEYCEHYEIGKYADRDEDIDDDEREPDDFARDRDDV